MSSWRLSRRFVGTALLAVLIVSATGCGGDRKQSGYFNTPFRIGIGDQVALEPDGSGGIDWIACGGDLSRQGFPGAVSISGLGWQPAGPNLTVTFLGDSFTVASG